MTEITKILENNFNLQIEDDGINKLDNHKNMYEVTAFNNGTYNEESYIIYDCTDKDFNFNFEDVVEIYEEYDIHGLAFIFKNWDEERKVYWGELAKATKAITRKKIHEIFVSKIAIYTDNVSKIDMKVEHKGVNYLEYFANDDMKIQGKIYNLSFWELKKLFNVTGTNLFRDNVRYSIKKDVRYLREKFKSYLLFLLYQKLDNINLNDNVKGEIFELLNIDSNFEELYSEYKADYFWFCHNGITIYSQDTVEYFSDNITLNPAKVSVINGAQTMTKFYEVADEFNVNQLEKINKLLTSYSKEIVIDDLMNSVYVKTVFIQGDKAYVRTITQGLNTQLPIKEETVLSNTEVVENINKKLKGKIKIVKDGEVYTSGLMYTSLAFAKKWLAINNQPGKSKNFSKVKIEELFKKILTELEQEDLDVLVKKLKCIEEADSWWNSSKKQRLENTEPNSRQRVICSYSKNYFGAFVSKFYHELETFGDELFVQIYEIFEEKLLSLSDNLTLGDFKMDALFPRIKGESDVGVNEKIVLTDEDTKELIKQLNMEEQSPYSFSKKISDFLQNRKGNKSFFRTISISEDGKTPRESFPFPNSTFNEIIDSSLVEGEDKYIDYDKSKFKSEILKSFEVVVIYKKTQGKNKNYVTKIRVINDFTFKKFEHEAKDVYDKTIKAFMVGDESEFVSARSKLSFHIRPKATNADDTFTFTNGDNITKRTFWANKETISEILDEKDEV